MSETPCTEQLELFEVGRQQVTMTFDGGQVVSDAGSCVPADILHAGWTETAFGERGT